MDERTEEQKANQEVEKFLSEISVTQKEIINLINDKKWKEAEELLTKTIQKLKDYKPKNFTINSSESERQAKEILKIMISLYSNLALVQMKQYNYEDAFTNSQFIIAQLEQYHKKSYIRMINILITYNQLDSASQVMEEARAKFPGADFKEFKEVEGVLKMKLKLKNNRQNKEIKSFYEESYGYKEIGKYLKQICIIGGISLGIGTIYYLLKRKKI